MRVILYEWGGGGKEGMEGGNLVVSAVNDFGGKEGLSDRVVPSNYD